MSYNRFSNVRSEHASYDNTLNSVDSYSPVENMIIQSGGANGLQKKLAPYKGFLLFYNLTKLARENKAILKKLKSTSQYKDYAYAIYMKLIADSSAFGFCEFGDKNKFADLVSHVFDVTKYTSNTLSMRFADQPNSFEINNIKTLIESYCCTSWSEMKTVDIDNNFASSTAIGLKPDKCESLKLLTAIYKKDVDGIKTRLGHDKSCIDDTFLLLTTGVVDRLDDKFNANLMLIMLHIIGYKMENYTVKLGLGMRSSPYIERVIKYVNFFLSSHRKLAQTSREEAERREVERRKAETAARKAREAEETERRAITETAKQITEHAAIEKQAAEAEQKAEAERKVEAERKRVDTLRKVEAERKRAESKRQTEARRKAEEEEEERKRAESKRQTEARRKAEEEEEEERKRASRVEAARIEAARIEAARIEATRVEAEAARVEAEAARVEAARIEAARVEAARIEAARIEAARIEAARIEAARIEAARIEAARIEAERAEATRTGKRVLPPVLFKQSPEPNTPTAPRLRSKPDVSRLHGDNPSSVLIDLSINTVKKTFNDSELNELLITLNKLKLPYIIQEYDQVQTTGDLFNYILYTHDYFDKLKFTEYLEELFKILKKTMTQKHINFVDLESLIAEFKKTVKIESKLNKLVNFSNKIRKLKQAIGKDLFIQNIKLEYFKEYDDELRKLYAKYAKQIAQIGGALVNINDSVRRGDSTMFSEVD